MYVFYSTQWVALVIYAKPYNGKYVRIEDVVTIYRAYVHLCARIYVQKVIYFDGWNVFAQGLDYKVIIMKSCMYNELDINNVTE